MNEVTINGRTYSVPNGKNINIQGGQLYVDGQLYGEKSTGTIEVKWTGPVADLTVHDGNVICQDVKGNVDAGGNVSCKDVDGDVDAGGNITCGDVGGDVDSGGNVNCGNVKGDVDAGGNVSRR